MIIDFAFVLVVLLALSGAILLADRLWLRSRRPAGAREPVPVDYARSFFPVILLVLVLRSFLYEPFRIPSDSMMPTLVQGDFIFVNKWRYGLQAAGPQLAHRGHRFPAARRRDRLPQAHRALGDVDQASRRSAG